MTEPTKSERYQLISAQDTIDTALHIVRKDGEVWEATCPFCGKQYVNEGVDVYCCERFQD